MLGAYIYGGYPEEDALTIYGTFNTSVAEKIDYTKNIVVIEGGNHAQFGNYGKQKGDPDATISSEVQQNITVEAIRDFLTE
ncbi:alpha/beta hydrolase [Alkalibacter rhizosphaerae]|uniref:alpha/beta hydrolase n=1 Tax=Alkalibacter rhizosphaerae TaxID=2815577 RepID=UPI0021110A6C|nr:alpha/beta hydrolase [Alkalibacter rhizosphaerae]